MHRDVKGQNVLLTNDARVRLIDFGRWEGGGGGGGREGGGEGGRGGREGGGREGGGRGGGGGEGGGGEFTSLCGHLYAVHAPGKQF